MFNYPSNFGSKISLRVILTTGHSESALTVNTVIHKGQMIKKLKCLVAAELLEDTVEWQQWETSVRGIVMSKKDYFRKKDEKMSARG